MTEEKVSEVEQHQMNCPAAQGYPQLRKDMDRIIGKLENGLTAKVNLIWRLQWWQIGILVSLIGGVILAAVKIVGVLLGINHELINELNQAIIDLRSATK